VLVLSFPAAAFGTNCYVLAPAQGEEALVVDPGVDVMPKLEETLAKHRLRPVAVLLTHGHLDHTFSVAPVCGAKGIPAYIHPDDRELLADPMKALSTEGQILFGGRGGHLEWSEPDDVKTLTDGAVLELAGLQLTVDHAPGHTRGSVMFRLPEAPIVTASAREEPPAPVCLSGDVLFCGSIGRTDLPGGDHAAMLSSLEHKVLPLPDEMVVYPGHGPDTTIGMERASNPYLLQIAGDEPFGAAPGRGL
jgi:hydroxyacylglutathione hydrolase